MVSIDQLDQAINKELTIYGKKITASIKKEARDSMKKLVTETRNTAPVGK